MKKLFFFALLIGLSVVLVACDERTSIPPTCTGTGTVYLFKDSNDNNQEIWNQSLNDFLVQHPELKVVTITPMKMFDGSGVHQIIMTASSNIPHPQVTEPASVLLEK